MSILLEPIFQTPIGKRVVTFKNNSSFSLKTATTHCNRERLSKLIDIADILTLQNNAKQKLIVKIASDFKKKRQQIKLFDQIR